MKMKANILTGLPGRVLVTLLAAGLFSSCELVREDLAECPVPIVELRFVYDYNMEFANAFHNQVDCLSAYFFDADGQLVRIEKVTDRSLLADENYRMHPELPEGAYHVVAYGGMECENASFSPSTMTGGSMLADLYVSLNAASLTDDNRRRLHNHYYGSADFTVDPRNDTYATVEMMRNTNSIQIALQNEDDSPIDCHDFIFEITDDNNDFNHENSLLPTGEITYKPYNTENRSVGTLPPADDASFAPEWQVALAQFTTSRLVKVSAAKPTATTLHVRRAKDDETVFRIPLVNYMLLFKRDNSGAGLDHMGDQEYLDRESSWTFVFFLRDGLWVSNHLIINDWEVRMNGTDF